MNIGNSVTVTCTELGVPIGTTGVIIDILLDPTMGIIYKVQFQHHGIKFIDSGCVK